MNFEKIESFGIPWMFLEFKSHNSISPERFNFERFFLEKKEKLGKQKCIFLVISVSFVR